MDNSSALKPWEFVWNLDVPDIPGMFSLLGENIRVKLGCQI
jgi:hypothetical protein